MKPRVLVVDNERVILDCFSAILEGAGFEVEAAGSALEAIATLQHAQFDLVITDIAMETDTSGFDVVQAAQEQPNPPEVVVLTGFPIPAPEWKQKGIRALFMKGGQPPNELISALKAILESSRRSRLPSDSDDNSGGATRILA